ncbi:MAG TPA: hypothetical protein PK078_14925 [Anaerolineales bacterium]|nr:hypothetical protein [Anaerolineales bacterium]HNB34769.1 hypothetical protein [Anaerolineales bacterium]
MITAYRTKVTVRSDGRIEISDPILTPGTQAEVILLVESQPENGAILARIREWEALFRETQSLPQAQSVTDEDIAAEIAAYRAEKKK